MTEKRKHYTPEQHRRESLFYQKLHVTQFNIKLNKRTDSDVIEFMDTIDNKRAYILSLIREDIKRRSNG